jgi:hypothetical protein
MPCVDQYAGRVLTRHRQPPLFSMVQLLSSFLSSCWSRYFCFGRFFPLHRDRVCCHETVTKLHRMRRPFFSISLFFGKRVVVIACNDDVYAFSVPKLWATLILVPIVGITVFESPNRRFHRLLPQVHPHEPFRVSNRVFDFLEWYRCRLVLLVSYTGILSLIL